MKKKIVFIIIFVVSLTTMVNFITAVAQNPTVIQNPLPGVNNICALLTKIANAVAGLVGVMSVIMITVAGIMFLLSAGNPEKINKAKTAFFYAIIGFVIAISAGVIVIVIKEVINAAGGGCQ